MKKGIKIKSVVCLLTILILLVSYSGSAFACEDCAYGYKWIEDACHDNYASSLWMPSYGYSLIYVEYSWDNTNYHPSMEYSEWCSGGHYWWGTLYKDYADVYGPYFMSYEDWDRDGYIDSSWYLEIAYGYYDGYIWLQY